MNWERMPWRQWTGRGKALWMKYKWLLLVLAAGLVLMLLPDLGGEGTASVPAQSEAAQFDLDGLERELEQALSRVEGVGSVTAVLTLRAGSRQVLAEDVLTEQRESSIQTTTTPVVVSRGSGQEDTVTLQEIYPVFQGALIVCEGGDQPAVQLKVIQAVSALTGLNSDKISICKGK